MIKKANSTIALLYFILGAIVISVLVSVSATLIDWIENPSGIFKSNVGTNWNIVFETFSSWFYPLLAITTPLSLVIAITWLKIFNTRDT